MRHLFSIFLFFLLAYPLIGEPLVRRDSFQKLPIRPSFGVSDASGLLAPRDKLSLEDRLRKTRKELNAEVTIMVMSAEFATLYPAEIVMKRIVQNWTKHDYYGIILHCPEKPDYPKVHIGGSSLSQVDLPAAQMREIIVNIEKKARFQETSMQRLDAALSSLTDELQIIRKTIDLQHSIQKNHTHILPDAHASGTLPKVTRTVLYVAMGISSAILIYLTLHIAGKKRAAVYFPKTSFRKRFCSPYSGGTGGKITLHPVNSAAKKD